MHFMKQFSLPYEASRKFLNSTTDLAEDLGDTLGEKLNVGGFRIRR